MKIQRALEGLGYRIKRIENGEPIPKSRLRNMERHYFPHDQPREVTINEQWSGPTPQTVRAIAEWFATCAVGASSKALATRALGIESRDHSIPCDPDDLNRCLVLISKAPAVRAAVDELARVSRHWKALADVWDQLAATFIDEAGLDWSKRTSAPRTYKMMEVAIAKTFNPPTP